MIVPSKFTTLDRTLLAKAPKVLGELTDDTSIEKLFEQCEDSFEDPGEFILTLDVLFVLGRIRIDVERGIVTLS